MKKVWFTMALAGSLAAPAAIAQFGGPPQIKLPTAEQPLAYGAGEGGGLRHRPAPPRLRDCDIAKWRAGADRLRDFVGSTNEIAQSRFAFSGAPPR